MRKVKDMGGKREKKQRREKPPVATALDLRSTERSAARDAREDHTENAEAPDGVSGIWT